MAEWISFKNALPVDASLIWAVSKKDDVRLVYFLKGNNIDYLGRVSHDFTHWMAIEPPAPPKSPQLEENHEHR